MRGRSRRGEALRDGAAIMAAFAGLALLAVSCGPDYDAVTNIRSGGSNIICFGDSITRGYGASAGRTYPEQLSAALGRPVINAGIDGDTTGSALQRLDEDVLSRDPWIVIVALSGNDFLRRVPETETQANLNAIVERCLGAGAIVVLVHAKFGILASDPYIDVFESVAERHGALLVRHSLKGILGNPSRMYDQIHPNDAGYALLAERVAEVVGPLAEASEASRGSTR